MINVGAIIHGDLFYFIPRWSLDKVRNVSYHADPRQHKNNIRKNTFVSSSYGRPILHKPSMLPVGNISNSRSNALWLAVFVSPRDPAASLISVRSFR